MTWTRKLERRGHKFARYGDDCNIYVKSKAAERVLENVSRFVQKRLKLKVNAAKSALERPWNRKFLGCSMTSTRQPKLRRWSDRRSVTRTDLCRPPVHPIATVRYFLPSAT